MAFHLPHDLWASFELQKLNNIEKCDFWPSIILSSSENLSFYGGLTFMTSLFIDLILGVNLGL